MQVIGQQWQFSYRYPSYDGLETPHLVLPVGRPVELHVTSLDVVHSFWAYQLGVKADANPGVDNVAYVTPTRVGTFDIRCAELCGIWHGYMFDTGRVVEGPRFEAWIREQQQFFAPYGVTCHRTAAPISRTRRGARDDGRRGLSLAAAAALAAPRRVQPAHRAPATRSARGCELVAGARQDVG